MTVHEYAFDVTLSAVVRVEADTEVSARKAIMQVLDAASLNVVLRGGNQTVRITEASAAFDHPGDPALFENGRGNAALRTPLNI